jgi:hypothetical protein
VRQPCLSLGFRNIIGVAALSGCVGIVVAAVLVAVNATIGPYMSDGMIGVMQAVYPVLWPRFVTLAPLGNDPAGEYKRWAIAVLWNAVPYAIVGVSIFSIYGWISSRVTSRRT